MGRLTVRVTNDYTGAVERLWRERGETPFPAPGGPIVSLRRLPWPEDAPEHTISEFVFDIDVGDAMRVRTFAEWLHARLNESKVVFLQGDRVLARGMVGEGQGLVSRKRIRRELENVTGPDRPPL